MDVCRFLNHFHRAHKSINEFIDLFLILGGILILTVVVGSTRGRSIVRIRRQGIAQSRLFVRARIQTKATLFESVVGFGALHVVGCGFGRRIGASYGAGFVRVGTGRPKGTGYKAVAIAAGATATSSIVGATANTTVAASVVGRCHTRSALTSRDVLCIAIAAITRSRMLLNTALSARTTTGMIKT